MAKNYFGGFCKIQRGAMVRLAYGHIFDHFCAMCLPEKRKFFEF
jgi:hypothetical protein